jgi:hypothetical protein
MRKEKLKNETGENLNTDLTSSPLQTDQEIQEQMDKRNEENQALKKLLENLKTSFPKPEAKS